MNPVKLIAILAVILVLGGLGYIALSSPDVPQTEVTKEIPADQFITQ